MSYLTILEGKDDFIHGKGAPYEQIESAEKLLNLKFSKDYIEYLSTFGSIMCNGHELTGLGNIDRTNVVLVTKEIKAFHPDIPHDWYVIENTNMDGIIIWQNTVGNIFYGKNKEYDSLTEFFCDL